MYIGPWGVLIMALDFIQSLMGSHYKVWNRGQIQCFMH